MKVVRIKVLRQLASPALKDPAAGRLSFVGGAPPELFGQTLVELLFEPGLHRAAPGLGSLPAELQPSVFIQQRLSGCGKVCANMLGGLASRIDRQIRFGAPDRSVVHRRLFDGVMTRRCIGLRMSVHCLFPEVRQSPMKTKPAQSRGRAPGPPIASR